MSSVSVTTGDIGKVGRKGKELEKKKKTRENIDLDITRSTVSITKLYTSSPVEQWESVRLWFAASW